MLNLVLFPSWLTVDKSTVLIDSVASGYWIVSGLAKICCLTSLIVHFSASSTETQKYMISFTSEFVAIPLIPLYKSLNVIYGSLSQING